LWHAGIGETALLTRFRAVSNRRLFAAIASLSAVVATAAPAIGEAAPASAKPNIVVVMSDDQDAASMRIMRHTKRLIGHHGVTFANNFATLPLCCPSRATFLTGQYAQNHGVTWNWAPEGGYTKLDHSSTLPIWLQDAGYHTALIGKYLNEYGLKSDPLVIPPGWDTWMGEIYPTSYRYYDFEMNLNGRLRGFGRPIPEYPFGSGRYNTDVLTQMASRYIRRRAASPQPFFLWLTPNAPHTTFHRNEGAPRYEGAPAVPPPGGNPYAKSPLPRPPNFNEQDISDKPQIAYTTTFPPLSEEQITALEAQHRGRYGALSGLDTSVRRLVRTLRRTGELRNTLFIYTSDNGWMLGQHRMGKTKYVPYEESIRIPLLIRGPGVRSGRTVTDLSANIDLASTILDAAGATAGLPQDGISLLPLARHARRGSNPPGVRSPRDLLIRTFPQPRGEAGALAFYAAIRTPRFKYVEWSYGTFEPPGGVCLAPLNCDYELYDLESDPYELHSLDADPAYASMIAELRARLVDLKQCAGGDCR
jgi:N-acetylglucosamine-6-sulfatase